MTNLEKQLSSGKTLSVSNQFQMNFFPKNDQIYVIDGGLGTTLHEFGLDTLADPLWLIIFFQKIICCSSHN